MANFVGAKKQKRRLAPGWQANLPTITRLILEKIGEAGVAVLDSFFPAKYPEARLWRKILGLDSSYEFKRASFASRLSQLQSGGLVAKTRRSGKTLWRLTAEGRSALRGSRADQLKPDGRRRVVCFDIPERDRAKRRWLRAELVACGYRQLQRSVWIGEVPLPTDFITDLDALGLHSHVHIFLVGDGNTIGAG